MSAEKKDLSRQSQLTLLLLALLPLWYSLGSYLPATSPAVENSPYYMECRECGLQCLWAGWGYWHALSPLCPLATSFSTGSS